MRWEDRLGQDMKGTNQRVTVIIGQNVVPTCGVGVHHMASWEVILTSPPGRVCAYICPAFREGEPLEDLEVRGICIEVAHNELGPIRQQAQLYGGGV